MPRVPPRGGGGTAAVRVRPQQAPSPKQREGPGRPTAAASRERQAAERAGAAAGPPPARPPLRPRRSNRAGSRGCGRLFPRGGQAKPPESHLSPQCRLPAPIRGGVLRMPSGPLRWPRPGKGERGLVIHRRVSCCFSSASVGPEVFLMWFYSEKVVWHVQTDTPPAMACPLEHSPPLYSVGKDCGVARILLYQHESD